MSDLEHVEKWLNWKLINQNRTDGTVKKYRGYLRQLSEYLNNEQSIDLLQVDKHMLLDFTGLYMHKKGLSPRSRRALVSAVRGFYKWAFTEKLISINFYDSIESPKAGRRLPNVATLNTAEKLLMAPDISTLSGIRDCTMIAIMAACGLRISGLVKLNESNLIWTTIEEKDRLLLKPSEKGDNERLIPAPYDVWLLVRAYLGHPDLKPIDRLLPTGDQVLFISLNNRNISADKYHGEARRISTRSVDEMIKKYGRKIGLPENQLHAHALRHLLGTELAEDGTSTLEIQQILGHVDANTTAIYTQLATRHLARTIDKSNPLAKIRSPVSELAKIVGN